MKKTFQFILPGFLLLLLGNIFFISCEDPPLWEPNYGDSATVSLKPFWDEKKILVNPYKGWYHHYYDGGTWGYMVNRNSDLDSFPGMNYLFLRLAWSYIEPFEGKYDWSLIDNVVKKWIPKGYRISLAITCKEPNMTFATPEWVKLAGAKGQFVTYRESTTWAPDYGDPVFLNKLNNFHAAFARKYASEHWLVDIKIASYGDRGEGNAQMSGKQAPSIEVIKNHIDLYCNNYQGVQLSIGDDYITWNRSETEILELKDYIELKKITYYTGNILSTWNSKKFKDTYGIEHPELFDAIWKNYPITLECEQYQTVKNDQNWAIPDGEQKGADILLGAIKLSHASYIGYHGYADKWLNENPKLAEKVVNLLGYWYFPVSITCPVNVISNTSRKFYITWLNKGSAPSYYHFNLYMKLNQVDNEQNFEFIQKLEESENKNWLPGIEIPEVYSINFPKETPRGAYHVSIRLIEETDTLKVPIYLGIQDSIRSQDNFYKLGSTFVFK